MIRRQSPVLRHGLTPHPKGLFACAQSPKFFPRATPTKEFSRPLFSGPTHAQHKNKRTTVKVVLFIFEREKGMMAAPVTLLTQGWLATLRAYRYAIIPKQLVCTLCISLFSRPLFSGPTHAQHKNKRTTVKVVLFIFEREKGMMAAPVTLLTQGWLATLRAYRYAIIPKQLVCTLCISLFSRPLFSGPRPILYIKQKSLA